LKPILKKKNALKQNDENAVDNNQDKDRHTYFLTSLT